MFKQDLESQKSQEEAKKQLKKPVKPSNQLQFETKEGAVLKVHCAFLLNANNERVDTHSGDDLSKLKLCVVYGSHLAPVIEKIVRISFMSCKNWSVVIEWSFFSILGFQRFP